MLVDVAIFLAAAVLAVPISKRLGLGSVLGYLVGGVLIGPSGLGLVREVEATLHFAEFGVVLLLFIVGLELRPERVWKMRGLVFGLGGAQVVLTTIVLTGIALVVGIAPREAVVAAVALSMSSTAFVLQVLGEKGELQQPHGRSAFGILLFQDVAAIPVLALVPLLGPRTASEPPVAKQALVSVAVMILLVLAGRFLLRPALRFVSTARNHDVSVAAALLVVVGTALVMHKAGLSMALGAFMAGVMLADSEYRHELEANIEPFKGLLLGLFFVAVGMSANLRVLIERPAVVLGLVATLTVIKFLILLGLGAREGWRSAVSLAIALSQGGEFGFVIFGVALGAGVMPKADVEVLVLVVTLSMALTPLLFVARDQVMRRVPGPEKREFDAIEDRGARVIIAGFGRFGQIVARVLRLKRISTTVLDVSPTHVDFVRRYGSRIYYGDASRVDLLRAAGAERAELFVLAIDDIEASLRTARVVLESFPHLKIVARARNRQHAYGLLGLGIEIVIRETFAASLDAARFALEELGSTPRAARRAVERFAEYDEVQVRKLHPLRDDEKALIESTKQYGKELERIFDEDARANPEN